MESSGFGDVHMKVSREQVAEHRTRILAAAARLFRLRGFEGVMLADVRKDAGLTHRAFYGYFPSKEALIAEAVRRALPPVPNRGEPQRSAATPRAIKPLGRRCAKLTADLSARTRRGRFRS